MADDYAFSQAMVRGLGAVPQGVGAGGSSGAPVLQATPRLTTWGFNPVGYWYTPMGSSKPLRSPQPTSPSWHVPKDGDWYEVDSRGIWVWFPKPHGKVFLLFGSGDFSRQVVVTDSLTTPKVVPVGGAPGAGMPPDLYWIRIFGGGGQPSYWVLNQLVPSGVVATP